MSKFLTTSATIIVLGLAATGAADARGGGGGFGGGGHGGFGGGHIGAMGGANIGGFGGVGPVQLGRMGAHLGGIGAAHMQHMGGIGADRLGAMGGTIKGHARGTRDFARHDRRFYGDWGYAASCAIYEPYYRSWCAGDVDSGIMQY
jgi:hypothetical protein